MKKDESQNSDQAVEGEGSYSATRRYNKHLGDAIESGELDAGAEAARRALNTPEGAELERAAKQAKRGPMPAAARTDATPSNPRK